MNKSIKRGKKLLMLKLGKEKNVFLKFQKVLYINRVIQIKQKKIRFEIVYFFVESFIVWQKLSRKNFEF